MSDTCRHELFAYDADAALAEFAAPFLDEGLDQGEALIAVYVAHKQALLRDGLGSGPGGVTFVDADEVYTRPEAAVREHDATIRQRLRDGAPSVRVMGELPVWETREQWDSWLLYDALLNRVFAHFPLRVVCTYDERVTPEAVMRASRVAHPRIHGDGLGDGHGHHNPHHQDPVEMVRSLTPEPQPLPGLRAVPAGEDALGFRRHLAGEMSAAGVPADAAGELLLAAAEIYDNAVRHGDGSPALRVGRVGDRFVCELADRGSGLDDPMAGYLPPRQGTTDGAGLWVARQLTSRLELLPTPGGGLTARLWT
jgi:anti-sigma regulatory factor (Ser/Thr protein kinase)